MPIRASERARYPKDWKAIVAEVKERAEDRCECAGECGLHPWGRCVERDGRKAFFARGTVVLTTAHLDHAPENNGRPGHRPNLKSMCNRCHLRYDRHHHAQTAAATRAAKLEARQPRML